MSDLAIPDAPLSLTIPPGWLEDCFVPAVLEENDDEVLDDMEARIEALIGYCQKQDEERAVLQAARTAIYARRGMLLERQHGGDRRSAEFQGTAARPLNMTEKENVRLARHWKVVWPEIVCGARDGHPNRTTKAYALSLIRVLDGEPDPPRRNPELVRSYLDTALELLGQAWEERDWGLVASARVYVEKARG